MKREAEEIPLTSKLLETLALTKEARPVTLRVEASVAAPLTLKAPLIEAKPITSKFDETEAADKVVRPVTFKVEAKLVAPFTLRVDEIEASPPISTLFEN